MNKKARTAQHQKPFDVLVMATMSAGKTSLVNALIGQELLHVANEATTACHTQVKNKYRVKLFTSRSYNKIKNFTGNGYSHQDQVLYKESNVQPKHLREWNANDKIKKIELTGKFISQPASMNGLVLHDTPGPNNSQTSKHAEITLSILNNLQFDSLIYLLNAEQLGTSDDRDLLHKLYEETIDKNQSSLCFVLNKVDLLDVEKGEDIASHVDHAQKYLQQFGFTNPVVIPCSTNIALYAKKSLNRETLTRKQRLNLELALSHFDQNKHELLNATHAPDTVKNHVFSLIKSLEKSNRRLLTKNKTTQANQLKQLIAYSGVETVAAFIQHKRHARTSK